METTEGVGNYFIERAIACKCPDLSQLKLQKLVYYAHGWHLGLSGLPLFAEPVQAWRYGPVIQSLRSEFRSYGAGSITAKARETQWENGAFAEREFSIKDKDVILPFLARVWDEYKIYTPIQLTNMTHGAGSPWHKIATHYQFRIPPGTTIPNALIRDHFRAAATLKR